eukprot:scaffold218271_cov51-Prasinocladus_malaysianus.AAC.1
MDFTPLNVGFFCMTNRYCMPNARLHGDRWSSVSRSERYKKRSGGCVTADSDNPLPDFIDPITLEPVVDPGISPYGHVMGTATWK